MKNLYWLLILTLVFTSCDKDSVDPEQELSNNISFAIERQNSSNDYSTSSKQAAISQVESGWQLMMDGKIQLSRGITYNVALENGDTLKLGFSFYKYETNPGILILQDQDSLHWNRRWKYTSAKLEAENFYRDFYGAMVLVNNSHVIFNDAISDNFKIDVKEAVINNKKQNIVTINFAGTAYGWYDPNGEFWYFYRIKKGKFTGVLE